MTTWFERGTAPLDTTDIARKNEENEFILHQTGPFIDVGGAVYNAKNYATIEAFLAVVGADPAVYQLPPGITRTLTADLTIPANVTLDMRMGVIATAGFTLTVNGPFRCGPWQAFDTSGGGSVVISDDIDEIWGQWWGLNRGGATDNKSALFAALTAADGRKVKLLGGDYLVDNGGADFLSPTTLAVDVWIEAVGREVVFKSQQQTLPTVAGGITTAGVQRNILYIDGAATVKLDGVTFDGGHDAASSTGADDVAYTYRQALLEVRNTTRVDLVGVRGTRGAPVYSPDSHGGAGEDDVEAQNTGLFFIRGCDEVYLDRSGIKGESWWEGWEVMECGSVQVDGFYSGASGNHYTPFNCWGPNTKLRFNGVIKNSPGSAIGVGGEDADIDVRATLIASGGVNLTRFVGATETRGFKTAYVEVNGSELQESSHGFAVKAGNEIARAWDGTNWSYAFGNLVVRGTLNGCLFGVYASHVRNVDVDMVIRDPVNVAAHAGHVGIKGKGHYVTSCEHVRLRGQVDAMRTVDVDAVACSPDYGYHVLDCTHLDADVNVSGSALTQRGVYVQSTVDGEAVTGGRYFRSCRVAGTVADALVLLGAPALKLAAIDISGLRRYTTATGMTLGDGNWVTAYTYRVVPIGPTSIGVSAGTQVIPTGVTTQVTLGTRAFGYAGDVNASTFRPRQRGRYRISAMVKMTAVAGGATVRLQLFKNGVPYRTDLQRVISGAVDLALAGSAIVELNGSTDYVGLYVEQTTGGNVTLSDAWLDCSLIPDYV